MVKRQGGRSRSVESEILGFIGEGTRLDGHLELKGGFRVDGHVSGTVTSPSALVVGPTGEVDVEALSAASLSVSGVVRGRIEIRERLEIHPGGRVLGHVILAEPGLVVAPGGVLEATLDMGLPAKASEPVAGGLETAGSGDAEDGPSRA